MDTGVFERIIGTRIKEYRMSQNLSMRELGRRTNLSVSFLSQVERGLVSVSINSLKRIAEALDVSILFFLDDRLDDNPVIRAGERKKVSPPGYKDYIEVISPSLGQKAEVILGHMSPGGSYESLPLKIPTDECIFIVEGSLQIVLEGKEYLLNPGDSISFKGSALSSFCCPSEEPASWVWVITPPAF